MNASDVTDSWLAEYVERWKRAGGGDNGVAQNWLDHNGQYCGVGVPDYANDIAAAMRLVEKICGNSRLVCTVKCDDGEWTAHFSWLNLTEYESAEDYIGFASVPAAAIRAAVVELAVGGVLKARHEQNP